MLNQMRRGAANWIAKVFMGILVVSFVVWGVADAFRSNGLTVVATVGNTDIPVEQFQSEYNRALQQLGQQMGRPVSSAEALQFGLPQQVLSRLVTEAAMSDAGKQLNIGLSDDELGRQIEADPNFKNASGEFDKNRMIQLIAANGMNEQSYVDAARGLAKRRQLIEGLVGGLEAPTVMVKDFDTYMNQERTVRYLDVPPRAIKPVGEPTEDQLKTFYEAHKAEFRAPEYRSATFVVLDPATLADPSKVSDADAQAAYDRDSQSYGTPETRAVQQIPFPDKAAADAALAKLNGGGTLDQVLADRKLTEKDIDLGTVAKTGLVDPKIADVVFSLPVNEFAEVDGRFGPAIVRVTAIEPAARKPFDSVKADIKQSMAAEKAKRDLLTTYDSIEDARAAGSTLKEIAAKNKLPLTEVAGIDSTGRTAAGQTADVPGGSAGLSAVFTGEVGGDHDPVKLDNGGFVWLDVTDAKPAHDRPLDEVKPEVAGAWKSDETQKALAAKADEVAAAIRKGETIDAAAQALGTDVKTSASFKRNTKAEGLTPQAIDAAFSGPVGTVATAPSEAGGRSVLVVASVTDPTFFADGPQTVQLKEKLTQSLANTLLGEYVAEMQKVSGVKINQAALQRIVAPNPES